MNALQLTSAAREKACPMTCSSIDNFVKKTKDLKLFFWALHNETRLMILKELSQKPRNVKELSFSIGELHSVTSFHLKHLRHQKMVNFRHEGKERIYRLTPIITELMESITNCHEILKQSNYNNATIRESHLRDG